MEPNILYSVQKDTIAVLTLNRPQAANSLSLALLGELCGLLRDMRNNPDIRCVIITGQGNKTFCAGADLKERARMNRTEAKQAVSLIQSVIHQVESLPQPVIASLNGSALGGGLELALACDIRIAADHIEVGLPETTLAIIPGAGGTQRLPRLIGRGKAKELIYTGHRISAQTALDLNLVEHVVPLSELRKKTEEIAQKIAANGPVAVRQAKFAINKGLETNIETGLAIEQKAYELTIPTKDRTEGLQAFLEKRKPEYKGE
ncbi:enoyl-CoA hydratase [Bacillus sonorensis]|uniref:Enoyl-CoA hydratase n=2 Tax=Bacillus sonorensis TaxID=119858 RepID=M5P6Y3_9BACI|nr:MULTISPECIES: enoyl-CoA hydratase [Bacillus]TWK84386.1 Short-chain-enoyl-CoA hydratase [Bacillus paralicheniformis]ASB89002.1 Enoyl-CoA hydratase [Bacillus sonorensis]EME75776.1 enoyl-CoA hydratase [Bacillus sonorensis L12]MBG9914969.1 enoyl-CoA hydratase [Bacillus sonorensis]MCF7618350.1 enoyl-CoA hydratase [Bacillus sonorensis]